MRRPDWIKCVADTHEDYKGKSWCGREITGEFHFISIDHAAHNGRNGGRLVPCLKCYQAIEKALKAGLDATRG